MPKKYVLTTLGCKVNQYESQQIRETLDSLGLHPARNHETPDIAIVNTCAVTVSALRKSRQAIRRVARDGRTPVIVVGCGATAGSEHLRRIRGVIATLGHAADACTALGQLVHELGQLTPRPPLIESSDATCERPATGWNDVWMNPEASASTDRSPAQRTTPSPTSIISGPGPVVKTDGTLVERIARFAGHQRAFLKVQDGCDARCTYCIIPRLRPRLRWKPVEVAVAEARDLVRAGHREIIVTGIFLGAYGRDTAVRRRFARGRAPLAGLIEALARIEGLERVRLSSLEPSDVDEALLDVVASHENCVPHLHLPLQSGSPAILRRMNRQYTVEAYLATIERVRAALERPSITTDIIVGFPGETDEDFQCSTRIARDTGFSKIHTFPFSPREGTAAARWTQEFVPPSLIRERVRRMSIVETECAVAYRRQALGRFERVLVEGADRGAADALPPFGRPLYRGRADRYFEIHFSADQHVRPGDLLRVRVDRVTPTHTFGTCVSESGGPPVALGAANRIGDHVFGDGPIRGEAESPCAIPGRT